MVSDGQQWLSFIYLPQLNKLFFIRRLNELLLGMFLEKYISATTWRRSGYTILQCVREK